jgi:hypothetical protein
LIVLPTNWGGNWIYPTCVLPINWGGIYPIFLSENSEEILLEPLTCLEYGLIKLDYSPTFFISTGLLTNLAGDPWKFYWYWTYWLLGSNYIWIGKYFTSAGIFDLMTDLYTGTGETTLNLPKAFEKFDIIVDL